jgi:hypothetical protein
MDPGLIWVLIEDVFFVFDTKIAFLYISDAASNLCVLHRTPLTMATPLSK